LALREALSFSLTGVFIIGLVLAAIGFCLTFFLKEIPLRTSAMKKETKET